MSLDLDELRMAHVCFQAAVHCVACGEHFPCTTRQLLDLLHKAEAPRGEPLIRDYVSRYDYDRAWVTIHDLQAQLEQLRAALRTHASLGYSIGYLEDKGKVWANCRCGEEIVGTGRDDATEQWAQHVEARAALAGGEA